MQFGMVVLDTYDTVIVPLVFVSLTVFIIGKLLYQLVTGKMHYGFNGRRLYELVTGKAMSRGTLWPVYYTRDEKPARYWLRIGIDFVIVVILFFMTRCLFTHDCDSFIWSW